VKRREFLKRTAALGALTLVPYVPAAEPERVCTSIHMDTPHRCLANNGKYVCRKCPEYRDCLCLGAGTPGIPF